MGDDIQNGSSQEVGTILVVEDRPDLLQLFKGGSGRFWLQGDDCKQCGSSATSHRKL